MKNTQAFEWNGATVTVRPTTIRDEVAKQQIGFKLTESGVSESADALLIYYFVAFVVQSEIAGDIGWKPPASTDSPDDLRLAFDHWCDMDGELFRAWQDAIRAVNASPMPPELQPEADEAVKKAKS